MVRQAIGLNWPMNAETHGKSVARDLTSDAALMDRVRRGDFEAFEALFERHRSLIYRFCYQMTNRRDDAEDMVQEVFVRAYQNVNRYRDEAKFSTWLMRIASNLGTDRARMIRRRYALEQKEASGALTWMTTNISENPIENMEREQLQAMVQAAIQSLSEHHRKVLIMRDFEEMEYADIGEIMGCSVGGAKLRVLRARRALRDQIEVTLNKLKEEAVKLS